MRKAVFMILMFTSPLFAGDSFLKQLLKLVSEQVNQPQELVEEKKDTKQNDAGPITTAALHLAKGAAIAAGSCVPLIVAGKCRANLDDSALDPKFIAGAAAMPAVPWVIKHFLEAGDATFKDNRPTGQVVANCWAKFIGSVSGSLFVWMMINAAYYNNE